MLRAENALLKQKQGFIGSDMLVGDFEGRKEILVDLQDQVAKLKAKYSRLTSIVQKASRVQGAQATRPMY